MGRNPEWVWAFCLGTKHHLVFEQKPQLGATSFLRQQMYPDQTHRHLCKQRHVHRSVVIRVHLGNLTTQIPQQDQCRCVQVESCSCLPLTTTTRIVKPGQTSMLPLRGSAWTICYSAHNACILLFHCSPVLLSFHIRDEYCFSQAPTAECRMYEKM